MDELRVFGRRLRELRCWRDLTLREAAGLAGLSFSFWGQAERGEKAVTRRPTLEAMADALRVHPADLTGQPWTPQDPRQAETQSGLESIEIALERYELGVDPGIPVRDWPQIQADIDRLVRLSLDVVDYRAQAELTSALIGELQAAYVQYLQRRREVLLGLIDTHRVAIMTARALGGHGLPGMSARAVQQCAETLEDPVWLGGAAYVWGNATGELDRAAQYRRSVTAADGLTGRLDSSDALQACGKLHLLAATAASERGDHDTSATHLNEASALAARMEVEVGTWANLFFGATDIGGWRTGIALERGAHAQALQVAKAVHPELLSKRRQAEFWSYVGRALVTDTKTRDKGVHVLLRAERLAPQKIYRDPFVRETVAGLLRQARRDAGGRELRGLAWRMGLAPIG